MAPSVAGMDTAKLSANLEAFMATAVASGHLPCLQVLVARDNTVVYRGAAGEQSPGLPLADDTIFRIYSMTKPVASVALMQLYEEGRFRLHDPLGLYIPSFNRSKMTVFTGGSAAEYTTEPCTSPVTICDILTHTAGLSYGYAPSHRHPLFSPD